MQVTKRDLDAAIALVMSEYDYLTNPLAICQVAEEEFDTIIMPSHIIKFLSKKMDDEEEQEELRDLEIIKWSLDMEDIFE